MVRTLFEDFYLPIVGQVKIGEKGTEKTTARGAKYRAPVQLPYFLITTQEKEENSVVPDIEMMDYYGAEFNEDGSVATGPTRLPIALALPDFKESFDTFYAYYDKARLLCKSDGETAYMYNEKLGDYVETACNPDICQNMKSGRCKLHGSLYFYLRTGEDFRDVQVGGVYVFRTTSKSTIYSLINSAYDIVRVSGDKNLAKLPLWLVYGRKTISTAEGLRQVPTITLRWVTNEYYYRSSLLSTAAIDDDELLDEPEEIGELEEETEPKKATSIFEETEKRKLPEKGNRQDDEPVEESQEIPAVQTRSKRRSRVKQETSEKPDQETEEEGTATQAGEQIPF